MSTQPPVGPAAAPTVIKPAPRGFLRRNNDTLGLAWLHGFFQAAVFRRQTLTASWACPSAVGTLDEFEAAFDEAVRTLGFAGEEVFLILAHEQFVHQLEQAPGFSESASRAYLRGRVERYEKEKEPVLWVSQRTVSTRQEATFVLHLLPSAFYGRINSVLLARRFDLTRVLPVSVPLQLVIETMGTPGKSPVLVAAETGAATTVLAARGDGQMLFCRTLLARWEADPARLGVEVNRSMLYAKQQFGAVIDLAWLLGKADEPVRLEVQARCGAGKEVTVRASAPVDWLQAVARLTPRHPVNLVAGYLGRKRRQQFARRVLVAGCWLGFTLMALDQWSRASSWSAERQRLAALRAAESTMEETRQRIEARNQQAETRRVFIQQVSDDRLPPVPGRLLALVASALPSTASLTEFSVKHDVTSGSWTFRFDGQMEADEETARDSLAAFQRLLTRSPLRIRFNDATRVVMPVPVAGTELSTTQRFSLEGVLF